MTMHTAELDREVRKWRAIAITSIAAAFVLLIAGLVGTSYGLRQAVVARHSEAAARKDADMQRDAAIAAREAEAAQRRAAEAQRDMAVRSAESLRAGNEPPQK